MPLKSRTLFFLLLVQVSLFAQNKYGFEWIRPYQPYYKLKITNDGVYSIDSNLLVQSGVNLNGIHPKRFQVFRNGVEVPIYVHGQNDSVFNTNDKIEFYAQKNDGTFDKELYQQPSFQPHIWRSMITDTAVYFFTILPDTTAIITKRFQWSADTDFSSFTAEPYFIDEVKLFPSEDYIYGPDQANAKEKYNSSEYLSGEGWAASGVSLGQNRNFTLKTLFKSASGPAPTVDIKVIPYNSADASGNNHHFQMSIGPDNASFSLIKDIAYQGYAVQQFNTTLSFSQIGNTTTVFNLSVVNDLNVASDINNLSYIRLNYSRQYNLGNQTGISFTLAPVLTAAKTLINFQNYGNGSYTTPLFFDLTSNTRIKGVYNAGSVLALVGYNGEAHQLVLVDSTQIVPITSLTPVQFRVIDPAAGYEYLLVSNPILANAASEYKQYNEQSRPHQYKTLLVYSQELYDYYTYGDMHPLAVRRFANHLLTEAIVKPQFLLLAGRGYQTNLIKSDTDYYKENLVPSIGVPSSDVMFTAGLKGTGFEADIPTGRIPATTNDELKNYLQKVIDMETGFDSIQEWRKKILHISGGEEKNEQDDFKSRINSNGKTIEGKNLGAKVIAFNKSVTDPQQGDLKDQLIDIQNNGISLMTFLGHGSLTYLDVDFGSITDLHNDKKYPMYYFNGCNIGNANDEKLNNTGKIYGKDYICSANKGALVWLAHSNFTFTNQLYNQMNAFYGQFCITNYGKPIGKIIQQSAKQLSGADIMAKSHCLQWLLQGDPAVVIYSPSKPDYSINSSSDLFIYPEKISSYSDSFAVAVIVTNLGKAADDTLEYEIIRTLPNGTKVNYPVVQYLAPHYYKDTVYYWIKSKDPLTTGNNVFEVYIDKGNKLTEISKTNNSNIFSFLMPGTGLTNLLPVDYSIVGQDTVALMVQNNDLFKVGGEYIFEIDTVVDFNSPQYQTSGIITANSLATWKVKIPQRDSAVYFWRARLNLPPDQGGYWNQSSFTYIKNINSGWSQSNFDQYKNVSSSSTLVFNTTDKALEFTTSERNLRIVSSRWTHSNRGILDPDGRTPSVGKCISEGIVCMLFDKNDLQPFENPKFPFNCDFVANSLTNEAGRQLYYYPFNTNTPAGRSEFVRFVDSIQAGTYVGIYAYYNPGSANWDNATRLAFNKLGSAKVAAMNNFYTTLGLIGIKGAPVGSIVEDTIFDDAYSSGQHPEDTAIDINTNMIGKWYTGTMMSKKIGPASEWGKLHYYFNSLENLGTDSNVVSIFATTKDNVDSLVYENVSGNGFDLSAINAKRYPFIKLQVNFNDNVKRTPDQFGRWMVLYKGVPEGTIAPFIAYDFYKDELSQGDSVRIKIAFKNIASEPFDSIPVEFKITDAASRVVKYTHSFKTKPLSQNEDVILDQNIPTVNLSNENILQVAFNQNNELPELFLGNNFMSKNFSVKADVRNPLMDVTFDGYRIMNGDFVSPVTTITITSKDDNEFRIQEDTSTFSLFIKRPGSTTFERVNLNSNEVRFIAGTSQNNKAVLEYKPERLADGVYTLQVLSRDASGNLSGQNMYTIDFNVVSASTITNFFPYPNPCTTSMRFVFTLTGSNPPDQLLVRIMTVSGKIIREITKEEFGHIKIGNNISEFAWDGTDEFGDRLANGVYLYQVLTRIDGEAIEKRKTNADKYVIQNTGKIYLMK